jgi:hypothetical protein
MKILNSLDLSKNRLLNIVLHPLASAPTSPIAAQIYYNTTSKALMLYDGSAWQNVNGDIATADDIDAILSDSGFES